MSGIFIQSRAGRLYNVTWVKERSVSQVLCSLVEILARPQWAKWNLRLGSATRPFIPKDRNYKVRCKSILVSTYWTAQLKFFLHFTLATQHIHLSVSSLALEVWEEHQHQTSPVNIFHRLCFVWKTTNSVRMKPSCGRKCEPTSGEKSSNQFTQPWWPDGKAEYALWYEDETFGLCDYMSCIKWCYTSHLRKYNCWLSCFSDDKKQKLIKTIKGRMEFDVPISNLFTWEPLMEPTVD